MLTSVVMIKSNTQTTFEALVPKFLDYIQYDLVLSKHTVEKYKDCLKWFHRDMGNLLSPSELSLEHITELKKQTLMRGAGPCRVNGIIFALRKFLIYCNEIQKIITINPKEIKPMKYPKREVLFLTKEEVSEFIKAMDVTTITGLRMRTLAELLLCTGMRISEALSINKEDVNWHDKEVVIIGKGNKQRTVFLNERVVEWLQMYLIRRKDSNPALFVTTGKSERLRTYDLSKQFKHYAQKAGLKKKVTPHILRHTAATTMSFNGCDIRIIQQILGHSDIETTARYYLGVDKRAIKEAHAKYLNYC